MRQRAVTKQDLPDGGEEWRDENNRLHREDGPASITRYENGNIKVEIWYKHGEIHRDEDKPAAVRYFPNGVKEYEFWLKEGKKHRTGNPAAIRYYDDGKVHVVRYFVEGLSHREGGPATESYYENGNLKESIWHLEDKLHREDGPAEISLYTNGQVSVNNWYYEGKQHREDGPARETFYENGNPKEIVWYYEGKQHREDGPARQTFYNNGQLSTRSWYRNGALHRSDDGPTVETFYENGNPKEISWYRNYTRHRDNGPALELFYENGNPKETIWYHKNKKNREDGPAEETFHENGQIKSRIWYNENKVHRESGPAKEMFHTNGTKKSEEWFDHGVNKHPVNIQEPSRIEYHGNGTVHVRNWTDEHGNGYRITDTFIEVYTNEKEMIERILSNVGDENSSIHSNEDNIILIKVRQGKAKGDIIMAIFNEGFDYTERYSIETAQNIKYKQNGELSKVSWINYTDKYEEYYYHTDTNGMSFSSYSIDDFVFETEYTERESKSHEFTYILNPRPSSRFDDKLLLQSLNDRPSVIRYDQAGNVIEEQWHERGRLSREGDLPAVIMYGASGIIRQREWFLYGDRGRVNNAEPSIIEYYEGTDNANLTVRRNEWYIDGIHRIRAQGGPGLIEYSPTGEVVRQIYYNELDEEEFEMREDYPIKDPNPVCDTVFQPSLESTTEFIERINTLRTKCYSLESTTDCDKYSRDVFRLVTATLMENQIAPTHDVTREHELESAFANNLPLNRNMDNYQMRFFRADGSSEPGSDAGGLRRQFFNSVCKQALDLFEYLNINSDDRRMFVSGKTDEELLELLNRNGQSFTQGDILGLYTFVGRLFIHAIGNEYSTEIPLSRVLLKAMVEADNGLATNDLLLYYLLETDIENVVGQVYEYDLGEKWLNDTAIAKYGIQNPLIRSRVDAFIDGFSAATPILANAKILPSELYQRVCITNITPEIFTKFIREDVRFGASSEQKRFIIESLTGSVFDTFVAELEFPVPVSSLNDRKTTFYKLLLKFWGEVNMIKQNVEYKIDEDRTMKRDAAFFPHTCFHQLTFNPIMINATDPINTEYEDPKMFFLNRLWASMAGSGVFTSS